MALLNIHDFTIPANEIVEKASIRFIQILVKQRIPPMVVGDCPRTQDTKQCYLQCFLIPVAFCGAF